MSGKIFKTIWWVAVISFLGSMILVLAIVYEYFTNVQKEQLRNETKLAAQGVTLSGEKYFEGLPEGDYRITWIAADGKVLFDNQADASKMENHRGRKEIRGAAENGFYQTSRYSDTLAERHFYAAQKLSDGTFLRLSNIQAAPWLLVLGMAAPICFVILLGLVVSYILARRLTAKLVEPINQVDPDQPQRYIGDERYTEVEPLLRRIISQQHRIKDDQKEVEKAALIRQEFTANASHELKTPLHAISGYAELIENGLVKDEDVREFAGKIRRESGRMTQVVEDIMDLNKLDGGDGDIVKEECDLYDIAQNAVDSLETVADEKGVSLHLEGGHLLMQGAPPLLYSIIYNLCDNAIKYNRPDGSVTVNVKPDAKGALLTVADTGIGIAEEDIGRIFERFYRVDKSRSKDVGGTGLGLSIVKHAAMLHGAKVDVESVCGEGTVFTVLFPD